MSKRSDSASDPERLIRIRIQIRPSQEVMDLTGSGSTQLFVQSFVMELEFQTMIPSRIMATGADEKVYKCSDLAALIIF
jgi:hypothetical protein